MIGIVSAQNRLGRRSIRLRRYDYSQAGAYFVTICVRGRGCSLSEVVDGSIRLNHFGQLAESCWRDLARHYKHVDLGEFVVMPNHVHGIIILSADHECGVGAGLKPAPTERPRERHGLGEIIRAFKTFSTRKINEARGIAGASFWQRNYYEHVIRDEDELERITEYITDNPQRWSEDEYYVPG